jgi:cell surface protein SprA
VNLGDEPIANSIFGLDGTYHTETPWLSKYIDKLPLISTKESSSITLSGEFARLVPGHSKAIDNDENGEKGVAYLDDFEGAESSYRLEFPYFEWNLSSTPRNAIDIFGQELFPEANLIDSLDYGMNRAKLAWYTIDPLFLRNTSGTPSHLSKDDQSNHYVREVQEREVFPNKENPNQITTTIPTFDLAYYPSERGPYNFDATNVNLDGSLMNPENRWGGIMRKMDAINFEAANIEFIEFWLLDPFLEQPDGTINNTGGEFYIQLGSISEDILRDSKKFFENGMPRPGSPVPVETSEWGNVPTTQPLTLAFDNDPDVRAVQDIGFDGLTDAQEVAKFTEYLAVLQGNVSAGAYGTAVADPSSDNYHYYRGSDFDDEETSITDRYKDFNSPQGNSATDQQSPEDYPTAAKNTPDTEDFNNDNTLTETEEYYQYNMRLTPTTMNVGENNIVSIQIADDVTLENGDKATVKWYQFRIPVSSYDNKVGNIADFRSIRFIRMFMHGWQQNAIMRFARLEMVRNQWRRYQFSLAKPGEYIPGDVNDNTTFDVSSVNIEENSNRTPVNYILPPGIQREQVPGQVSNFAQNEQALSVRVCDLEDGDARAVYKTLNLDIRNFKRLRMYIHAEADPIDQSLKDGELRAFMRIGSDFTENYYEYEIPLIVTPAGIYDENIASNQHIVWPLLNNMDIELQQLINTKIQRNNNTAWPRNKPFTVADSKGNLITVIGNPDLGQAKSVMLGVVNPKSDGTGNDDGLPKCGEVWFNELRMTEFEERGGYAALAKMDVKLADLGTFTISGNMYTIGFGSLEQNLADRSQENYHQYDASLNLNLGKLFPRKAGVVIPTHMSYSRAVSTPQYDPFDTDVLLETKLAESSNPDSLKRIAQDITTIRSINFTNVSKVAEKRPKFNSPWQISNFDATYAYSETERSNPTIKSDKVQRHKAALGWGYGLAPLSINPFKKLISEKRKGLALVRNFNFNPIPSRYTFKTEVARSFGRTQLRKLNADDLEIEPTFDKEFTWDRFYGMTWDLTKSMSFNFNAANRARIDEPQGELDTQEKRDSVINNIKNFGRTTDYNHSASLTYNMPLKFVPFLDWTQVRTSYNIQYNWGSAPFQGIGIDTIGNTISNSQSRQVNADLNFKSLYNKSKFLKKYNRPSGPTRGARPNSQTKKDPKDKEKGKGKKKKKKGDKTVGSVALETAARAVISLKKISVNYTESFGTLIPGYRPKTELLGMEFGRSTSPGWEFISGYQPDLDWLRERARDDMFVTNENLSYQFTQNYTEGLNIKATIEPIKDMRGDITLLRDYSYNTQRYFQVQDLAFDELNQYTSGTFTMSFIAWNTTFDKPDVDGDGLTDAFRNFSEYRQAISLRQGAKNPHSSGTFVDGITGQEFATGYGPYALDVLLPAFVAAYTGETPEKVSLSADKMFNTRPKPNWRLTYNGLGKMKPFDRFVQTINLSHGYVSTFSIAGYSSNVNYVETVGGSRNRNAISDNFESKYDIQSISITEQMSPLLGIDVTWKNGMTTRLEMRSTRNLTMSFVDYQLNENKSNEFTIGLGYRFTELTIPFTKGAQKLESDMNLIVDFSIADNKTVKYILDQNVAEPTSGAKVIRIAPSIDYVVNERVNIRIFYDRQDNIPATSASFRQTNTNVGVQVRFTLSQ